MSLASIIATDKFISFLSDGRVVNIDDNSIVKEDYSKVHRINDKIVIAITGSKDVSDTILGNLDKFDLTDFGPFGISILEGLKTIPTFPKSHIIIGGINAKGNIAYTRFDTYSDGIRVIDIPIGGIDGQVLFNGTNIDFNIKDRFESKVQNVVNAGVTINPTTSIKIQTELNNEVALQDYTVNTTVFSELVIKK